jgi:LmbE family N-acetylglucosaminyl deacetylase
LSQGGQDTRAKGLPAVSRLLAVGAHPDDESFGLGALVSAFVDSGTVVSVLCFTHGEASTLGGGPSLNELRERELGCAADALGVDRVVLLDYPDGALSEVALEELSAHVTHEGRSAAALLVFDRGGITGHPDHVAATEAALQAAVDLERPVYAWAVEAGVAEALNAEFGTGFVGRERAEIDLELHVDRTRQVRAISCHRSQSKDNPIVWRRLELQGDVEYLLELKPL